MTSKTRKPYGVYREQATAGSPASGYLSFGAYGLSITADRYVHEGHSPAFNTLPWKADYDFARRPVHET
jgi:hypothetical protein